MRNASSSCRTQSRPCPLVQTPKRVFSAQTHPVVRNGSMAETFACSANGLSKVTAVALATCNQHQHCPRPVGGLRAHQRHYWCRTARWPNRHCGLGDRKLSLKCFPRTPGRGVEANFSVAEVTDLFRLAPSFSSPVSLSKYRLVTTELICIIKPVVAESAYREKAAQAKSQFGGQSRAEKSALQLAVR